MQPLSWRLQDFTDSEGGKRIRQSAWVLNFRRIGCDVYCDTYYGPCKSLRGNKYCQIFATPFHFVRAFSMKSRAEVHSALDQWLQQIGVPRVLIPDGAGEFTEPESQFVKKAQKVQCPVHPIEPYSPNQSIAEDVICSTPFSAAFLEYRMVLNQCLTGLTMSRDSLTSRTATAQSHESVTLVNIHDTSQIGTHSMPNSHNGYTAPILQ